MRSDFLVLLLVTGSVAAAGCFGDGGATGELVDYDCREREYRLSVTNTMSASVPLYTLNDGVTEQRVVAMGFQVGDGNPIADEENPGLEVPNPEIRAQECDTVVIIVQNLNDLPHTFHVHGNLDDWTDDGVPFVSQMPIHNGDERTYVFEDIKAGTYWYHCHVDVAHHIDLGMYGAFIVEEREPVHEYDVDMVIMLDEWDNCHIHGSPEPGSERETGNYPEQDADCEERKFQDYYAQGGLFNTANEATGGPHCDDPNIPQNVKDELGCGHGNVPPYRTEREWYFAQFPPYTPIYNTFTINGKAFPDTKPIFFEEGLKYRIRMINVGEEWHSMHIHGHQMLVAYRDLDALPAPFLVDTLSIGPGERFDVIVEANNPGFWVFHDHVALNVANDYQSPGGMFTMIAYADEEFRNSVTLGGQPFDPTGMDRAIEVMEWTKAYHEEHGDHAGHGERGVLPKGTTTVDRDPITGVVRYTYN